MTKPIAVILVANGVQDEEFIYPYYRLQEAGFNVKVLSCGETETYRGRRVVRGKYGIPFAIDDEINSFLYYELDKLIENTEVLIIPGGWQCPEILRQNNAVLEFVRKMDNEEKIIGAICHGPQVLISAGICKGRNMTCFMGMKDDLINAGAKFDNYDEGGSFLNVVTDGHIITAQHYRDNPQFMKQIFHALEQYRLETYVVH